MTPLKNNMPRESAKYFAVLLQVVQGQHLLEHEILPEYKCFVGSGSKLLLPDVLFFFLRKYGCHADG